MFKTAAVFQCILMCPYGCIGFVMFMILLLDIDSWEHVTEECLFCYVVCLKLYVPVCLGQDPLLKKIFNLSEVLLYKGKESDTGKERKKERQET